MRDRVPGPGSRNVLLTVIITMSAACGVDETPPPATVHQTIAEDVVPAPNAHALDPRIEYLSAYATSEDLSQLPDDFLPDDLPHPTVTIQALAADRRPVYVEPDGTETPLPSYTLGLDALDALAGAFDDLPDGYADPDAYVAALTAATDAFNQAGRAHGLDDAILDALIDDAVGDQEGDPPAVYDALAGGVCVAATAAVVRATAAAVASLSAAITAKTAIMHTTCGTIPEGVSRAACYATYQAQIATMGLAIRDLGIHLVIQAAAQMLLIRANNIVNLANAGRARFNQLWPAQRVRLLNLAARNGLARNWMGTIIARATAESNACFDLRLQAAMARVRITMGVVLLATIVWTTCDVGNLRDFVGFAVQVIQRAKQAVGGNGGGGGGGGGGGPPPPPPPGGGAALGDDGGAADGGGALALVTSGATPEPADVVMHHEGPWPNLELIGPEYMPLYREFSSLPENMARFDVHDGATETFLGWHDSGQGQQYLMRGVTLCQWNPNGNTTEDIWDQNPDTGQTTLIHRAGSPVLWAGSVESADNVKPALDAMYASAGFHYTTFFDPEQPDLRAICLASSPPLSQFEQNCCTWAVNTLGSPEEIAAGVVRHRRIRLMPSHPRAHRETGESMEESTAIEVDIYGAVERPLDPCYEYYDPGTQRWIRSFSSPGCGPIGPF